ncbi:MAG: hypothetical protein D6736_18210 [Nitrospinota bacterium]|nr:MAG: hypothetical protein D6736_18210 [Nitrospinota bacterium]
MKKRLLILILIGIVVPIGYLMVPKFLVTPSPTATARSRHFPIFSHFELPRDYGYFIGDEIPLTLIIEAEPGVVIDLVNLPQKGETHGPFEIRDLAITSSTQKQGKKIYRVHYRLQYFGPTPLTTRFAPLEILYATSRKGVAPEKTYTYQSLFTQPVTINISRIGPYQTTQPVKPKAVLPDRRALPIGMTLTLGTVFLVTSVGGWTRRWWQKRLSNSPQHPVALSAAEQALQALRREELYFFPPLETSSLSAGERLDQIFRQYLQAEFGLSAATLTPAELAPLLDGVPLAQEILALLEECAILKYRPTAPDPGKERELWWKGITLLEKLERIPAS